MKTCLKKNWFFLGIGIMLFIAFWEPVVGIFIRQYKLLNIGIFIAFLVTGLTLETSSLLKQLKNVKELLSALISSLILFPVIAYFIGLYFFKDYPDFVMGALIIGVAPVTVASGTVMTTIARGNVSLSLFICVLANLFAILTIPFMLNLILQFGDTIIELPLLEMLTGLIIKVFIPTVLGQLIRPFLKKFLQPFKPYFSIFNQGIVLLIILNAVSSSTDRIIQAGSTLLFVFTVMIGLHIMILLINYGISRLIRLDLPSTAAFTIHTSQKTLTVSYLVWAGYFAESYPMALIPPIAYHLTQMIMDTIVAQRFRLLAEVKDRH